VTVLHIDSSINGDDSVSRTLTRSIVDRLPGEKVVYRDLAHDPLPHLTSRGEDPHILEEFLAADAVVIGAPMYNFTLPSQLKAWIDRIVVAGSTFRYTADGPEGLAGDKRVIVALARGGFYQPGSPAAGLEYLESYLRSIFGFMGIEPEFVVADGIGVSSEQREQSLQTALGETMQLAA
jgi:FMN-dependent NADH-azoreductase